jgi:hypothetical protein
MRHITAGGDQPPPAVSNSAELRRNVVDYGWYASGPSGTRKECESARAETAPEDVHGDVDEFVDLRLIFRLQPFDEQLL